MHFHPYKIVNPIKTFREEAKQTVQCGSSVFSLQNLIMAWLTLPDMIFSEIMMMVGLESLESLHRCRQVCSKWNEKILTDIWESQSKKKIMKERIEKTGDLECFQQTRR